MTTLIFDVKPEKFQSEFNSFDDHLKYQDFYHSGIDTVEVISENVKKDDKLIDSPYNNGLLGTIYQAYSKHIPLTLRPDDIWIAIINSFGNYVNNHAEEMRNVFVDHQGKRELVVNEMTYPVSGKEWTTLIDKMTSLIKKYVKTDIVNWMKPEFTTTTETDVTISQITLMGATREYFERKFGFWCGLSQVTLLGELEDWQKLYKKAKQLYDFKDKTIDAWTDLLLPVLQKLIDACNNIKDEDFWQKICTSVKRGSSGNKTFRGWFLVFAPFDEEGEYLLNSRESVMKDGVYGNVNDNKIVSCSTNVSVKIDVCGNVTEAILYGGLLMTQLVDDSLAPKAIWTLIRKKELETNDLIDMFLNKNKKYDESNIAKCDEDGIEVMKKLIKFACYVADRFKIPDNEKHHLVDECEDYYSLVPKYKILYFIDYPEFYCFLGGFYENKKYYNRFYKFIDLKMKDEICKAFAN